jgi:hypothetical protein
VAERLQRAVIVERTNHHERLARGGKRVDIEQHVVLTEQGAQPVRDLVFKILRVRFREQVAIQVTVAIARDLLVRQRIDDRDERDAAGRDVERAAVDLVHHASDGFGAAHLVAVGRAHDDDARARLQARVVDGFELELAGRSHEVGPGKEMWRYSSGKPWPDNRFVQAQATGMFGARLRGARV